MKTIFASQRIDGGGNQSPRYLAEKLNYILVPINQPGWENEKAEEQVWYMNDDIYRLQGEDREKFLQVLSSAKDIKVVLNFVMANTYKDNWLIDYPVSKVIFLNKGRVAEWEEKTKGTRHSLIPAEAITPPIDLDRFKNINREESDKIRIGRHSRISLKYPDNPCDMYRKLDREDREFSFMLAHPKINKEFPHFKCYNWNELSVEKFLEQQDIYLVILNPKTKEQGGRSNMEAMAAGCCVIVEDRDGMQDYIENGKTGYLVKSEEEAIEIVNSLTKEKIKEIGSNAREYAFNNFTINKWNK